MLRVLYQQPHSDYTKVWAACQGQSCRSSVCVPLSLSENCREAAEFNHKDRSTTNVFAYLFMLYPMGDVFANTCSFAYQDSSYLVHNPTYAHDVL